MMIECKRRSFAASIAKLIVGRGRGRARVSLVCLGRRFFWRCEQWLEIQLGVSAKEKERARRCSVYCLMNTLGGNMWSEGKRRVSRIL